MIMVVVAIVPGVAVDAVVIGVVAAVVDVLGLAAVVAPKWSWWPWRSKWP